MLGLLCFCSGAVMKYKFVMQLCPIWQSALPAYAAIDSYVCYAAGWVLTELSPMNRRFWQMYLCQVMCLLPRMSLPEEAGTGKHFFSRA